MLETLKREWIAKVAVVFFVIISVWWLALFVSGVKGTPQNYLFGVTYGLICLWGGFWGLVIAQKWGGWSSVIGKALIVLSLGLFAQEFGQLVFSFYNVVLKVEVPYPSLADIGFFGTIPFYAFGMFLLARAAGAKFSLQGAVNQLQAVIIPAIMLVIVYLFFLRDYSFDFFNPLKMFLDFGYPLGEAIYVSIAILTYSLSRKFLGGIMRSKILFIVAAFMVQFGADFNFLFQSSQGTWTNGGYGDYLYFLAYFLLILGLFQFKTVSVKLGTEN